ncbi:AAA family ATPase [Rhodococcus sp. CX]|uniref:AAA family ATPase n=1 Tax=Rhodococcus sp. CX TaxID=2789880 RepID=UPI0018CE5B01|nr:AAA family ATPase [Rhodococcus sp. CX]MBH0122510.1 AAA family ATPase [Rhodococcus sp. CX]
MLRVSVLGEQAITDDATGAVVTRSPRALALVAFLVAHAGTPQPRQRLATLFWPDSTDGQSLTNLRRELHHLRHALGDEPSLTVTAKDLCWSDTPSSSADLRVFDNERAAALRAARSGDDRALVTHARRALDAYSGEFLPGVFDDWALEIRSDRERRCVELCDLLSGALTRTGDPAGAIEVARRRVRLAPLEEVGYRNLMRLQAETGDRAGAAGTYHRCASLLERELGVLPDPQTRALVEQVLGTAPGRRIPARTGCTTVELVGRSREIDRLAAAWQRAASGRPGAILIRGGAGVGKTRLLTEITHIAQAGGATVAHSRCFATSAGLALAPVADWLRDPAVAAGRSGLARVWRAEVERLVPSPEADADRVRETRPERGVGASADAWQRHRFFEGLARGLVGDGRPILLTLDNMQWCDRETLLFLAFCLGLTPDAPLLVAAAARDDSSESAAAVTEWATGLASSGTVTELRLGPLDAADSTRLAEAIGGRSRTIEERRLLHTATGGFPLYIVEAMRSATDGDDALSVDGLSSVLHHRVEQSSPAAREVAGLAAAVGRDFTLDLLTTASDLGAVAVVQAVDELWRRRIVTEFRDGYDFAHDLLREAAYATVGPPQRWLLHRRLAQALELLHRDDTDPVSAQLAEQYARGGRPDRAVPYYRRAAEIATRRFAYADAVRLHRHALALVREHPGSGSAARELAILEALAAPLNARYGYSSPELQHTLERSIELADTLGRTESTIVGLVGLWSSRFVQGDTAGAHRAVTRALTLVEPGTELCGSAHFAYAGSAVSLGRPAEALGHFALAAELTAGAHSWTVGTRPDVHGCAWAAHAHWLLGDDDAARTRCREAITLARRSEDPFVLTIALAYGAVTRQLCGDRPELRETVTELRELCDRYDFAYYREWGLILDGWSRTGGDGIGRVRRGIANLRAAGSFARMPYWLTLLADLYRERPGDARATLDAATVAARARDDRWWLPEVMRMRAAYDAPPDAVARLRAAARLAGEHGSVALVRRCDRDLVGLGVPPSH